MRFLLATLGAWAVGCALYLGLELMGGSVTAALREWRGTFVLFLMPFAAAVLLAIPGFWALQRFVPSAFARWISAAVLGLLVGLVALQFASAIFTGEPSTWSRFWHYLLPKRMEDFTDFRDLNVRYMWLFLSAGLGLGLLVVALHAFARRRAAP